MIYNEDCFNIFKKIPDNEIDLVLTDPPRGITACKWDVIPDLDKLWIELKRIGKENCAYVFITNQPFATDLINSNRAWFRYEWIWEKNNLTGFLNAKIQPLRKHENIIVFYKHQPIFNPIKTKRTKEDFNKSYRKNDRLSGKSNNIYNPIQQTIRIYPTAEIQWYKNPESIIEFQRDDIRNGKNHPTQKPVALMEYLIKTYTKEGNIVLDPFMGTGATGMACKLLKREFIGCEINKSYFEIAKHR